MNELSVPFGGWLAADLKPASVVIVAPATGHFGASAVQVALAMGVRKVRVKRLENEMLQP